MKGERDCYSCRWATYDGSNSTAGGNEAQGFDQVGCALPLLLEAYALLEPVAMLLEGLMINAAEGDQGCPWHESPTSIEADIATGNTHLGDTQELPAATLDERWPG